MPKTATKKSPVPNTRSFGEAIEAFMKVVPKRVSKKGKPGKKKGAKKKAGKK
jgi:hypothetical protein